MVGGGCRDETDSGKFGQVDGEIQTKAKLLLFYYLFFHLLLLGVITYFYYMDLGCNWDEFSLLYIFASQANPTI